MPMIKLAEKYSRSDVAMAKLCKRQNIPRPGLGYWAKKAAGKKVMQSPLPNSAWNPVLEITILDRAYVNRDAEMLKAKESMTSISPVVVAKTLLGCHSLVSRTRVLLDRAKPGYNDLRLQPPEKAPLDVRVTKDSVHRALLLFDALLKALVTQGFAVGGEDVSSIEGVGLSISITEGLHYVEVEPEEHNLNGKYSFQHDRRTRKQVPSGILTMEISGKQDGWRYASGLRWRDGKRKKLEDHLTEIVARLSQIPAQKREHEEYLEQQRVKEVVERERQRKVAHRRAEIKQAIANEESKLEELVSEVESWEKSQKIRRFIEAMENRQRKTGNTDDPNFVRWVKWASDQANRIDPLSENPVLEIDHLRKKLEDLGPTGKGES